MSHDSVNAPPATKLTNIKKKTVIFWDGGSDDYYRRALAHKKYSLQLENREKTMECKVQVFPLRGNIKVQLLAVGENDIPKHKDWNAKQLAELFRGAQLPQHTLDELNSLSTPGQDWRGRLLWVHKADISHSMPPKSSLPQAIASHCRENSIAKDSIERDSIESDIIASNSMASRNMLSFLSEYLTTYVEAQSDGSREEKSRMLELMALGAMSSPQSLSDLQTFFDKSYERGIALSSEDPTMTSQSNQAERYDSGQT